MARRGGGIFQNVDPITGVKSLTSLSWGLIALLVTIIIVLVVVLPLIFMKRDTSSEEPKGPKHPVAPPMSEQPGRINIAEVAQSPSSGQAIIYFSQGEASGTTCETCTATFDIQMTYVGGTQIPSSSYQKVTAPTINGVVTFDYSIPTQSGGTTPPLPTPPSQVKIDITARSVNPQTGASGSPTTFSKTLPYI